MTRDPAIRSPITSANLQRKAQASRGNAFFKHDPRCRTKP